MNTLLSVLEASPDAAREWLEAGQIPESLDAWNALERLGSRGLSPELRQWLSTQTSSTAVWLDSAALEAEERFEEAAARLRTIRESLSGDVKALAMVASARNLLRAGQVSEAWIPLREAAKITDNSALLRAASRLLSRARKIEPAPSRRKLRLAILTSFTADFLTPLVDVCCFDADHHNPFWAFSTFGFADSFALFLAERNSRPEVLLSVQTAPPVQFGLTKLALQMRSQAPYRYQWCNRFQQMLPLIPRSLGTRVNERRY